MSASETGGRLRTEAALAALAALVFIALSVLWLAEDRRLPGAGDPGRHLQVTLGIREALEDWDFTRVLDYGPIGEEFFYPPAVHVVGAIPAALGLPVTDWGTFALNLVFVPLLALGCFGVGRRVFGPPAGLLAAVFALATPMVLNLFHVYLLDAPLAAAVAVALWALLASEGFTRRRQSILAGVAVAFALLVKSTAPLYLAGAVAVILLRGGWRQWRNLALAALALLVIAGPYYSMHLGDVFGLSSETTGATEGPGGFGAYERFSLSNLLWYGWNAVNVQYYLPLLALFAVGLAYTLRGARRIPHAPELLVGLATGYLLATFALAIRDPRYTLPLIVFVAVIATGWIPSVRRPALRVAGVAALLAIAALNVASTLSESMPRLKLNLVGEESPDLVDPGALTINETRGFVVGVPRTDPFWHELLGTAEEEGLETARLSVREAPLWGVDNAGFSVLADRYGIEQVTPSPAESRRADLRLNTWFTRDNFWVDRIGLPAPCATVEDGTKAPFGTGPVELSVSVERLGPDGRYERWCSF